MKTPMIEILSIDLSNHCHKQCSFCYNHSSIEGTMMWQTNEVLAFAKDCIQHGVKAISLGGGEPLEHPGIFRITNELQKIAYVSITTNGLPLLNENVREQILVNFPDKIHLSLHFPDNLSEVDRVCQQIEWLKTTNIKPGVNLLVSSTTIDSAKDVYSRLRKLLEPDQIIILPMRYGATPSAKEIASVAGGEKFQSPSCLLGCSKPERFVSVSYDTTVNHCSYAGGRQPLQTLDYAGLIDALSKCAFSSCRPNKNE